MIFTKNENASNIAVGGQKYLMTKESFVVNFHEQISAVSAKRSVSNCIQLDSLSNTFTSGPAVIILFCSQLN